MPTEKPPATRLKGITLLAAQTPRSQAYIQCLVAHELLPDHVIILGEDVPSAHPHTHFRGDWRGIILPNLAQPVSLTCEQAGIPVSRILTADVNAEDTAQRIRSIAPRMIIYSGIGGQIVSDRILNLGPKLLHMHSGWLPEYRGSTTLFYALLNNEQPGVTALFLDRTIDTGPIVARCHYPKPPQGMDLDRVYDAAIRADTLAQVMRQYARTGVLPTPEQQQGVGKSYYVIHPVLKHLAILSLSTDKQYG